MALNLIKVRDKKIGKVLIGVAHVVAVKPLDEGGCRIILSTDVESQGCDVHETVEEIATLANRRPPDGF